MPKKRLTTEEFIRRAKIVHSDLYDYSISEYITARHEIKIICKIHGVFEQLPRAHMKGHGCYICSTKRINTDKFIKKAKTIHFDKFDYSLVNYVSQYTKIKLKCNDCNYEFEQYPNAHLKGQSCSQCYHQSQRIKLKDFIERSNIIHHNKYDYTKVDYVNNSTNVVIVCPVHGDFKQTPSVHLNGGECKKCNISSKNEEIISIILSSKNIIYHRHHSLDGCKYKHSLPFDFYLPDYNSCIEFDGIQHFQPIEYFGGQSGFDELKIRDAIKTNYCVQNNIPLLRLDYKMKSEKFNEIIFKFLGF